MFSPCQKIQLLIIGRIGHPLLDDKAALIKDPRLGKDMTDRAENFIGAVFENS